MICVSIGRGRHREMIAEHKFLAEQGVGLIELRVDPEDFGEIAGNLLDNARLWARSRVTASAETVDGGVRIAIADDGPGMTPEIKARVLDPFSQGDEPLGRRHEGIGLGLPLVARFAELHGGRVAIDSADSTWLSGVMSHYGEEKGRKIVGDLVRNLSPVLIARARENAAIGRFQIDFRDGQATYRNRFISTRCFEAEQVAGHDGAADAGA